MLIKSLPAEKHCSLTSVPGLWHSATTKSTIKKAVLAMARPTSPPTQRFPPAPNPALAALSSPWLLPLSHRRTQVVTKSEPKARLGILGRSSLQLQGGCRPEATKLCPRSPEEMVTDVAARPRMDSTEQGEGVTGFCHVCHCRHALRPFREPRSSLTLYGFTQL